MRHIKKLMGMHNKETYVRVHVYTRICARVDIRIYAKYGRNIRVCVVWIYLICTVHGVDRIFILATIEGFSGKGALSILLKSELFEKGSEFYL